MLTCFCRYHLVVETAPADVLLSVSCRSNIAKTEASREEFNQRADETDREVEELQRLARAEADRRIMAEAELQELLREQVSSPSLGFRV